jgi:hypothetical protein
MTLIAVDVEVLALCPRPSGSQGWRRLRFERAARRSLTGISLPRCKSSHHACHLRGFGARACAHSLTAVLILLPPAPVLTGRGADAPAAGAALDVTAGRQQAE